ncbi:MAG: OmpA family protein [Gammaproteobacteria bacterium]
MHFPSRKSEIQTNNLPLMNKIIRAIKIFPNSRIEISGHTDSTGSDNINQSVSQARVGNA